MREHCLNEFDFPDPYLQQKKVFDSLNLSPKESLYYCINQFYYSLVLFNFA